MHDKCVTKDVPISEFVCCVVYLDVKNYFNIFWSINNLTNELSQKKYVLSNSNDMILLWLHIHQNSLMKLDRQYNVIFQSSILLGSALSIGQRNFFF